MYQIYWRKKCTGKDVLFDLCTGVTAISLTCVLQCTGISMIYNFSVIYPSETTFSSFKDTKIKYFKDAKYKKTETTMLDDYKTFSAF